MTGFLRTGLKAGSGLAVLGLGRLLGAWAVARWQGAEVQGALGLAVACMSFGAILFACGFDYANAYIVGRDPGTLWSVIRNSLLISGAAIVVGPLWGLLFAWLLPTMVRGVEHPSLAILVIGAGTGLLVAGQTIQSAAIGAQDIRGVAMANTVAGISWCVLAGLTARFGGYLALLVAWACVQLIAVSIQLRRLIPRATRPTSASSVLGNQLRYGVRTLPGGIARALNMRAALYLGSRLVSAADLGIFVFFLNIAEALLYLPNALSQVVLAWTARHGASVSVKRVALGVVGVAGLLAAGVAWAFGGPLLSQFVGATYAARSTVLAVMLLATTAQALGIVRIHELFGLGKPGAASAAQLVALCVTVLSVSLLVPAWGIAGGALSLLLAYGSFAAYVFLPSRWISSAGLRTAPPLAGRSE